MPLEQFPAEPSYGLETINRWLTLTRGRSAQDPPCPCATVRSKKKKKKKSGIWLNHFSPNFPWEASKAFSEVVSDENSGRTTNWVDPVKLRNQGFHMVWVSQSWARKLFDLWRYKNWNLWFWAIFRDLSRRKFGGTEKRTPHDTLQTPSFQMV